MENKVWEVLKENPNYSEEIFLEVLAELNRKVSICCGNKMSVSQKDMDYIFWVMEEEIEEEREKKEEKQVAFSVIRKQIIIFFEEQERSIRKLIEQSCSYSRGRWI